MSTSDGADQPRTGADQPIDPEDLAMARGRDPTPQAVERARQEIAEVGTRQAVEDTPPDESGNPTTPPPTEEDRRAGLAGA